MSTRIASIDAGFDALKGIFNGIDGEKLYIPNVIYPMQNREVLGYDEGNILDELHVKITSGAIKNNGCYAVGNLATKFTVANQSSIHDRKGESDQTIILLLTAIAYDTAMNNNSEFINVEYLLSTGLPIDEAKQENARKKFASKLKNNTHLVEFLETPKLKGKKIKIQFKDVFVNTEGHAAMINITMDDQYKPQNINLLKQNVLIIDIGGNTTDFAFIKKGSIDNENSNGIPLGIGNTLDAIIRDVHATHRYKFKTRRELVECIISNYIINPAGKSISIKSIVDEHLQLFSQEIYKEIQYMWDNIGNIQNIQVVGGSGYLIKEFVIQINKDKYNLPIQFQVSAEQSIWAICKAYQKLLVMKAQRANITI